MISRLLEVITGPIQEKYCGGCEQIKATTEFHRLASSKDGYRARCKTCTNDYDREWHARNPDHRKDRALRSRYGITIDERDAMIEAQQGLCGICDHEPNGSRDILHVDHDEVTGIVRGMLCMRCNTAIGNLDHDIERLKAAIRYLGGSC